MLCPSPRSDHRRAQHAKWEKVSSNHQSFKLFVLTIFLRFENCFSQRTCATFSLRSGSPENCVYEFAGLLLKYWDGCLNNYLNCAMPTFSVIGVFRLLLRGCDVVATLLLRCCYVVVTLLLRCCYVVVTFLLRCFFVTLLLRCCYVVFTLLLRCCNNCCCCCGCRCRCCCCCCCGRRRCHRFNSKAFSNVVCYACSMFVFDAPWFRIFTLSSSKNKVKRMIDLLWCMHGEGFWKDCPYIHGFERIIERLCWNKCIGKFAQIAVATAAATSPTVDFRGTYKITWTSQKHVLGHGKKIGHWTTYGD